MPSANASSRAWNSQKPTAGSMVIRMTASGLLAARSSISIPPSREAITMTRSAARSTTMPKYSSRAMATPSST